MSFHGAHSNSQLAERTVGQSDSFPSGFSRSGCCWGAGCFNGLALSISVWWKQKRKSASRLASRPAKCHQPGPEHVAKTSTIEAKAQTKTSAPRMCLNLWKLPSPAQALNYLLSIII